MEGCGRKHYCKDFCSAHYQQLRRGKDPHQEGPTIRAVNKDQVCSEEGCNRPALAKGLCNPHYLRKMRHGDPRKGGAARPRRRKQETCSFPGCERGHFAKGWCPSHYRNWKRHGTPEARPKGYEARKYLEEVVLPFSEDSCLIWPHSRRKNGYGVTSYEGRSWQTHRLVCFLAYGPPPSPSHHAAHTCGKGAEGCVNPRHLYWATPRENWEDSVRHGTAARGRRNGQSKLTPDQVREIRQQKGAVSQAALARRFGVSPGCIRGVVRGHNWAWLPDESEEGEE